MGNWNRRRWVPRQKYNNYQEIPPSPPRFHRVESQYHGVSENSVPSWEKDFCFSAGIPWRKFIVAKKYISCYEDVIKWNDSAGEEAFLKAKERFWAKINGLPCDTPLPDPDMFIDEVDWNLAIDPELMLDLDREYFNPDEAETFDKVEIENQQMFNSVPSHSVGWDNKNTRNGDDPWESSHVQGAGSSKDAAQGWNQWDNSSSKNVDNPWEQSYSQGDEALKGDGWGDYGNNSWGRNLGQNNTIQSKILDNNFDNLRDRGGQSFGYVKAQGWGDGVSYSQGWNCRKSRDHESTNFDNRDSPCQNNFVQRSGTLVDRGWKDCSDNSWGWERLENRNRESKHDSRRAVGDGRPFNGGYRKREHPQQQTLRNKNSRFQGDDYGIGPQWRKGRTQNRVSFV